MNRKTAKLIRAFCKLTNKSYRGMKKEFYKLTNEERSLSTKKLKRFYDENIKTDVLSKNYYDLKLPLPDYLKNNKEHNHENE